MDLPDAAAFQAAFGREPRAVGPRGMASYTLGEMIERACAGAEAGVVAEIGQRLRAALGLADAGLDADALIDLQVSGHSAARCAACKAPIAPGAPRVEEEREAGALTSFSHLEAFPYDSLQRLRRFFCNEACRTEFDA